MVLIGNIKHCLKNMEISHEHQETPTFNEPTDVHKFLNEFRSLTIVIFANNYFKYYLRQGFCKRGHDHLNQGVWRTVWTSLSKNGQNL